MLRDPITALPSDVVGGKCCPVTVLSLAMLKASLFVMVVLRSVCRTLPWIILKLLFTRMIVVVCLILNKVRGIESALFEDGNLSEFWIQGRAS